jgi:hypothetical protein
MKYSFSKNTSLIKTTFVAIIKNIIANAIQKFIIKLCMCDRNKTNYTPTQNK